MYDKGLRHSSIDDVIHKFDTYLIHGKTYLMTSLHSEKLSINVCKKDILL
jgi:hypothetical protein